jgi:signal transduction histidine kinase
MKGRRSLTGRLIGLLVLVQTGVAVAGMTAWMLFSPFVSFEDVAAETTREAVVRSLREEAGQLAIRPDPVLLSYAASRPSLVYAAIRDNAVLPGSSGQLADVLARLGPVIPRNGQIDAKTTADAALIRFASMDTPFGEVVVASLGDTFGLDDFGSFLTVYLAQLLPLFGPAVLMAALVIPLVVRSSLRPVVEASTLAETIEIESLHRRIPAENLPSEVAPLATAVNALLGRLEDGIARQRLFSANAAHELRTPVAILEAKIDGLSSGPARHDLKRAVNRIALLLNQLLAVARLGQREVRIDEDTDLQGLLRAVVADCAPLALRMGRTIAFQGDAHAITVRANRQALGSALANLIDNALSYEPAGGTVIVTCARRDKGAATITVEDHGPGIPADARELVFEPFWRKDEARVGSGLGLSIAAQILRLHGGEIGCRETAGGGATFEMALPVADVSSAAPGHEQARSA